jgi:hypothetical protein
METRVRRGQWSLAALLAMSLLLSACALGVPSTESNTALATIDPASEAEAILTAYLTALHEGRYEEAAAFYGGTYDTLVANNPDVSPSDHASLLERWCTMNGGQCLPVLAVLSHEQTSSTGYSFIVQFADEQGALFEIGPCCGEPDTGQRTTDFTYNVQRGGGTYKVLELPPYVP